ncbi:MAG TPA: hypothetical protein VGM18_08845 [Candidatus Sulfotelmatobacter sp.]|jgi:hypothetical protein
MLTVIQILLRTNTKCAIRIAFLTVGLVGTFIAASVEPVPAADGGPILVCPSRGSSCGVNLSSVMN